MKAAWLSVKLFASGILRLPLVVAESVEALSVCVIQTVNLFQGDILAMVKVWSNAGVAFAARQMLDAQGTNVSLRDAGREMLFRVAKANHCSGFVTGPKPVTDEDRKRLGLPLDSIPRKLDA